MNSVKTWRRDFWQSIEIIYSAQFVYLFFRYEPYSELRPIVPFQSKFPI
jgi:hypothetical protein